MSKHDKLFMADTGLMSAMLNWRYTTVRLEGDKNGKLLETYVLNQLRVHLETSKPFSIYYYRDREKREIDFIVENEDGSLLGIEVKAGSLVSQDSFKHLRWFKKHIAKERSFVGIVLYTGSQKISFEPGMWALPINVLWAS